MCCMGKKALICQAQVVESGHEEEMWKRLDTSFLSDQYRSAKQETYYKCPKAMARMKMVRTEDWKLVVRLAGGNELYNMKKDPYELNNLYGIPEYNDIVLDLQLKMLEWCLRTDTDRPYQPEVGA